MQNIYRLIDYNAGHNQADLIIDERAFLDLENKDAYIDRIYTALFNSSKKDELINNRMCLNTSVRSALEDKIKSVSLSGDSDFKTIVICVAIEQSPCRGFLSG